MTDRPTCKTCRHWASTHRQDEGEGDTKRYADFEAECRIRAPLFVEGLSSARWPRTCAGAWCGEHEAEPPAPPPWACPSCEDAKPHVHVARFEDNGINTHEWIEKVYVE
jgi:hypothetical protein